jgi:hypothetical protein
MHLSDLWLPEKYDLAAALVCTNAIEEKYEMLEFVVGDIRFHRDGSMTLFDLSALPRRGETGKDDIELTEPEIPDVSHGTGPFNIINPLTGAFDNSSRRLVSDIDEDSSAKADATDNEDQEYLPEESEDAEDDFLSCIPDCFSKDTCLPLLGIVQMLEILERKSPGRNDVFFSASAGGKTFTIGRIPAEWDNIDTDEEDAEPCDVLWEAVKALL